MEPVTLILGGAALYAWAKKRAGNDTSAEDQNAGFAVGENYPAYVDENGYVDPAPFDWDAYFQYGDFMLEGGASSYGSDGGYLSEDDMQKTTPSNGSMVILPGAQTRGEKNNNPGNITKSGINWQGEIIGNDSRFETFESPEYGIRALARLLRNYQRDGLQTIAQIISRYAPPNENNTGAYIGAVSQATGVNANIPIDLSNPELMLRMVNAIIQHENGRNIYAGSGIVETGISLA